MDTAKTEIDAAMVRRLWPEVLDAVKVRRRVAWMILQTATVTEVRNNVLTLSFNRDGDRKGFEASGAVAALWEALVEVFGVNLDVLVTAQGSSELDDE